MGYTTRADESGASGWLKGGFGGGQKNQVSQAAANQPIARMTRRLTIRLPIVTPTLHTARARTMPERRCFRHELPRRTSRPTIRSRSAQKTGDFVKTPTDWAGQGRVDLSFIGRFPRKTIYNQ